MSNSKKRLQASLEKMSVPDLQRKFKEATGKATRAPNKTYLIRCIIEATEAASRASRNDDESAQAAADSAEGDGGRGDAAERRADASNTQAAEAQTERDDAQEVTSAAPAEEGANDPSPAEPGSSEDEHAQCRDVSASQAGEGDRPGQLEAPSGAAESAALVDRVQHDAAEQPTLPLDDPNESAMAGNESLPSSHHPLSEAATVETTDAAESAEEGGDEPLGGMAANEALGDPAAPEGGNLVRDAAPTDSVATSARGSSGRRRGRRAAEGAPDGNGAAGGPAEATVLAANRLPRGALTGLTIAELQAKYREVVGRPTGSSDKPYLMWKIREATKGKVPTGPRSHGRRSSQGDDVMVLPLRLPATTVDAMDGAWRSRGIRTRMDFLREAIRLHLDRLGAPSVAALFVRSEADVAEVA